MDLTTLFPRKATTDLDSSVSSATGDPGIEFGESSKLTIPEKPMKFVPYESEKIHEGATAEQYAKVPEGGRFRSPEGDVLVKPYTIQDISQIKDLPEETPYQMNGKIAYTPKFDPISLGTDVKYAFATSPEMRKKALIDKYGEANVFDDPIYGEYTVKQDGKLLRPRKGDWLQRAATGAPYVAPAIMSGMAEMAAPVAGPLGLAAMPIWAGAGAAAGHAVNLGIANILGVYDKSAVDVVTGAAEEAGMATGGSAVGALAGAGTIAYLSTKKAYNAGAEFAEKNPHKGLLGATRYIIDQLPDAAGKFIATMGGTTPEAITRAIRLNEEGMTLQHPATFVPHLPMMSYIAKFDQQFRKDNPLFQSIIGYYEGAAQKIADIVGVKIGPVTKELVTPDIAGLGKAAKKQMEYLPVISDKIDQHAQQIKDYWATRKTEAKADVATQVKDRSALIEQSKTLSDQFRTSADVAVQDALQGIIKTQENDIRNLTKTGSLSDIVHAAQQQFDTLYKSFSVMRDKLYSNVYATAGEATVDTAALRQAKLELTSMFPEKFPERDIVDARINSLLEKSPTFQQVHSAYKFLSEGINWDLVHPGYGSFLERSVIGPMKKLLTDPPATATPELKAAAKLLREADDWYGTNIEQFNSKVISSVRGLLKAGMPPNPEALAEIVFSQPHMVTQNEWLKNTLGKDFLSTMVSSDLVRIIKDHPTRMSQMAEDGMMEYDLLGSVDAIRKRISQGHYNGAITPQQMEMMAQLERWAEASKGKVNIPIDKDDTITTLYRKGREVIANAEKKAIDNPIAALNEEAAKAESSLNRIKKHVDTMVKDDPLGWLNDTSVGANAAGNKILSDPDILNEFVTRHGFRYEQLKKADGSFETVATPTPALTMLRAITLQKVFQAAEATPGALRGIRTRARELGAIIDPTTGREIPKDTIQALLPVGRNGEDTVKMLHQMVEDIQASLPTGTGDIGSSFAGAELVLSPLKHIPGGKIFDKAIFPVKMGAKMIARFAIGGALELAMNAINSPEFLNLLRRGMAPNVDDITRKQMINTLFTAIKKEVPGQRIAKSLSATGGVIGAVQGENLPDITNE